MGSLLVREQTIKQVRGLLMEGVSEIDAQFFEIVQKVWPKLNDQQHAEIETYLKTIVEERSKAAAKKAENFPVGGDEFGGHLMEQFLTASYDTYTRWRLTKKILSLSGHTPDCIGELEKFAGTSNGAASLNSLRNDYAHKSRKSLAENHDDARCVQIRKALRSQAANIDSILGSE